MADIETLAHLQAWAGTGGVATIAPGTYTLDADLDVTTAGSLTHDGTAGHVVIDGVDTYDVTITDVAVGMAGVDNDHRIQLTQMGADACKLVNTTASRIVHTFGWVDWCESGAYGLLCAQTGAGGITGTASNCRAYNNYRDGISSGGNATDPANNDIMLWLTDVESYTNGKGHTTDGDGLSLPKGNHNAVINGGSFHGNTKFGIVSGESTVRNRLWIYGGTKIYDNAMVASSGQLKQYAGTAIVQDVEIYLTSGASATAKANAQLECQYGTVIADRCIIDLTYNTHTWGIYFNEGTDAVSTTSVLMDRCVIRNKPSGNGAVYLSKNKLGGFIRNCLFYNNYNDIYHYYPRVAIQNNIFYKLTGNNVAINCGTGAGADSYTASLFSGYNCFWGLGATTSSYVANNSAGLNATDVIIDPQFADAAAGDYRATNRAVLTSGVLDQYGRNTPIGVTVPELGGPIGSRQRYSGYGNGWRS